MCWKRWGDKGKVWFVMGWWEGYPQARSYVGPFQLVQRKGLRNFLLLKPNSKEKLLWMWIEAAATLGSAITWLWCSNPKGCMDKGAVESSSVVKGSHWSQAMCGGQSQHEGPESHYLKPKVKPGLHWRSQDLRDGWCLPRRTAHRKCIQPKRYMQAVKVSKWNQLNLLMSNMVLEFYLWGLNLLWSSVSSPCLHCSLLEWQYIFCVIVC